MVCSDWVGFGCPTFRLKAKMICESFLDTLPYPDMLTYPVQWSGAIGFPSSPIPFTLIYSIPSRAHHDLVIRIWLNLFIMDLSEFLHTGKIMVDHHPIFQHFFFNIAFFEMVGQHRICPIPVVTV